MLVVYELPFCEVDEGSGDSLPGFETWTGKWNIEV